MALTKIGYTLIKDDFKTAVSGSDTEHSSSYSTRVTLLEGSGSITESSASFSTRVALLEGSGSITESSASYSTRVTTAEASGALFDGTGAVTFATVDTGQGANELYDMDQNVLTTSSPTFVNITATGTVTAEEFHTEFVSASIAYVSGSTKFGDTSDDVHSFTGSIHLTNSGSVSGSIFSTGSFGAIYAGGMSVPNLINVSSSVSTRATTLENANISGGFVAQTVLSGSGTLISGSVLSTGSFGSVVAGGTGVNSFTGNVGIGTATPDALLQVSGSGLNGAPTLAIDNTSTSAYIHSIEALGGAMTSGQINIINLGKIGSTKNSGVIGYKWDSAGSDDNLLTFEHWGTSPLMVLNGAGKVGIGTQSPSAFLHVSQSTVTNTQVAKFERPEGSNATNYMVSFENDDTTSNQGAGILIRAGNDSGDTTLAVRDQGANNLFTVLGDGRVRVDQGTLEVGQHGVAAGQVASDGNFALHCSFNDSSTGNGEFQFKRYGDGTTAEQLMVIKDTGNVGINKASPTGLLHVWDIGTAVASGNGRDVIISAEGGQASGDTNGGNLKLGCGAKYGGGGTMGYISLTTADASNSYVETMRLTSGHVGIGMTAPVTPLHITQASASVGTLSVLEGVRITNATGTAGDAYMCVNAVGYAEFGSAYGDGSRSTAFKTNSSFQFWHAGYGSGTEHFRIAYNGDLTATDTNGIGSISDERTKKNIQTYSGSLSIINTLRPVTYEWKSNRKNSGRKRGFIAQEVTSSDAFWVASSSVAPGQADWEYLEGTDSMDIADPTGSRTALVSKLTAKDTLYVSAIQELTQAVRDLRAAITGSTDLNQLKATISGSTFV